MLSKLKNKKGFTLIEIVLVLAIAALIILIVFIALSGAQKSRRDTQRKNDLASIASGLEQYNSNNSGQYPITSANWTGFAASYITQVDPNTHTTYITGGTGSGIFNAAAPGATVPGAAQGDITGLPPLNQTTTASVAYQGDADGTHYQVCIQLEQSTSGECITSK